MTTVQDVRALPERARERIAFTPGCWQWLGAAYGYGYGSIRRHGKTVGVHRFVYEELVGPIAPGMQIDHLCRNRRCVNPSHLEPVTPQVNVLRGRGAGAQNRDKTHCKRGHEFTEENTRHHNRSGGGSARTCIACQRIRNRASYLRRTR